MASNTGQCLCGQVTYQGKGARGGVNVCHCADCRRWGGGPAAAVAFEQGFDIQGEVRWFQSSDWAERGSCPACGSALFYRLRDGSYMNASAGSLDDQESLAGIETEIFIDSKPAYYDFAGERPRLTAAEAIAQATGSGT